MSRDPFWCKAGKENSMCTYGGLEVFEQAIFISGRRRHPVVTDQWLSKDESEEGSLNQYCESKTRFCGLRRRLRVDGTKKTYICPRYEGSVSDSGYWIKVSVSVLLLRGVLLSLQIFIRSRHFVNRSQCLRFGRKELTGISKIHTPTNEVVKTASPDTLLLIICESSIARMRRIL